MSARYFGRKRKKQKLMKAKSGLVGIKVYLEKYNRVKQLSWSVLPDSKNDPRVFMNNYCYKKNSVIRLVFATKIETAVAVQSSQNLHQMLSQQNNTRKM